MLQVTLDLTLPELWCVRNLVRSCDHGKVWDRGDMQRVHAGILTLDRQIQGTPSQYQNAKMSELTYRLEVSEEFVWAMEQQVNAAWMWGPVIVGHGLLMKTMRLLSGDKADADLPPDLMRDLEEVLDGHRTRNDAGESPREGAGDKPGETAAS